MPTKVVMIGAGGHAKVVYDALKSKGGFDTIEIRDSNLNLCGQLFLNRADIIMPLGDFIKLSGKIHISIGNNQIRSSIGEALFAVDKELYTIIHPRAIVSEFAQLGQGVFVAASAVVAPEVSLAAGVIINHRAIVDHDCCVNAWAHIAPNATLGGGVIVGRSSLIGAGAIVLPGVSIGDNVTVGAGAVVTKDVKSGTTVVGIPARDILGIQ